MENIRTKQDVQNEVSEWFALEKYSQSGNFTASEWAEQIAKRSFINTAIQYRNKAKLDELMSILITEPLASYGFYYRNRPADINQEQYSTNTVMPMSFWDLHRLQALTDIFACSNQQLIDEWSIQNTANGLALSRFGHLIVDLNARDEDIRNDFNNWLNQFRRATNTCPASVYPKQKGNRFSWWVKDASLLPYSDLLSWCYWKQVKLCDEKIVELLYPGLEADRSKLRKLERLVATTITIENAIAIQQASLMPM